MSGALSSQKKKKKRERFQLFTPNRLNRLPRSLLDTTWFSYPRAPPYGTYRVLHRTHCRTHYRVPPRCTHHTQHLAHHHRRYPLGTHCASRHSAHKLASGITNLGSSLRRLRGFGQRGVGFLARRRGLGLECSDLCFSLGNRSLVRRPTLHS
jgi:hypothetical protein